jgi:hypothetical protein
MYLFMVIDVGLQRVKAETVSQVSSVHLSVSFCFAKEKILNV